MRLLSGFKVVVDFCATIGTRYSGASPQLEIMLLCWSATGGALHRFPTSRGRRRAALQGKARLV